MSKPDFSGWATKPNLLCSDGRIIMPDAFKHMGGKTCPLVWGHQHTDVNAVLGHALLTNKEDGLWTDCWFNDTESGQTGKLIVQHGDIESLSIYANQLQQKGPYVLHGDIREVSLVLAGANPGASIQSVLKHGEESDEEAVIYTGEEIVLSHADDDDEKDPPKKEESKKDESSKKEEKKPDDDKKLADIFATLNEEQQEAVYAMIGMVMKDEKKEDEKDPEKEKGGDKDMKHNVFDQAEVKQGGILSHSDQKSIIESAKLSQVGSFQTALKLYAADNKLEHDAVSGGFVESGEGNIYNLFPEYKEVRPGAPELITNDQGWIGTVMSKVHKSPISRIRTSHVDIRKADALKAQGYVKGKKKKQVGNFNLARRTTDPQTVYVKNALHRDDIIDITDFDYVGYLYKIDQMNLKEELATAIMLGDGRDDGDEGKIMPDKIRPIWTDDDLYTIHVDLDIAAAKKELQGTGTGVSFGENYIYAEAMVNTMLYAREDYRGSGTPDLYCTPHMLNVMLLARDLNGRRIYSSKAELAATLNVGNIITAEQFEGKIRTTSDNSQKKLLAMIANLSDYSLGSTKGGEVTHFNQFDIDFNQQKSLLETRCSGALTRLYSAIVIEEPVTVNP